MLIVLLWTLNTEIIAIDKHCSYCRVPDRAWWSRTWWSPGKSTDVWRGRRATTINSDDEDDAMVRVKLLQLLGRAGCYSSESVRRRRRTRCCYASSNFDRRGHSGCNDVLAGERLVLQGRHRTWRWDARRVTLSTDRRFCCCCCCWQHCIVAARCH